MEWSIISLKKKSDDILMARYSVTDGTSSISGDIKFETDKNYDDLTEIEVIDLVKTRISQNMDGSTKESNVTNIEDTVTKKTEEGNKIVSLPWEVE